MIRGIEQYKVLTQMPVVLKIILLLNSLKMCLTYYFNYLTKYLTCYSTLEVFLNCGTGPFLPLHYKRWFCHYINSPENCRSISLLNVCCKFYTSTLTRRLTFFVDCFGKLHESPPDFRLGYFTVDNHK